MSQYTAIREISESLRDLVEAAVDNSSITVWLETPKEMRNNDNTGISLWLYRITRNEHLLNQPRERVSAGQVARRPIPVNLHYLITPIMAEPRDEQLLLGRILQLFNDHPALRGADLTGGLSGEVFRITLETLSVEDLTRIWGALQEPYQTSLTYPVQVVEIESGEEALATSPVLVGETTYAQILSSE